ncbi:acyltransferase family protein [Actinoplanes sp. NPDC051513]|uniref:acyltransferase family protein n=1 Tax=Actinoplanes sp. NPDC051513 TaxID=3363908 RepID=UPI003787F157
MDTPTGETEPQRTGRIVALDGLRLAAALMVALFHYAGRAGGFEVVWGDTPAKIFPFLHRPAAYGWLGVELFFLISGFVICMSAWDRDTIPFLRSRAIRLFPAYWAAVLITATAVYFWPVVTRPAGLSNVLLNLTMLQFPLGVPQVDGVYWTLWNEARFYLLFALLVWRGLTVARAIWFGYGWLTIGAVAMAGGEKWMLDVLQPAYSPLFVAGMAFFLIHRFGSSLARWGLVAASFLLAQHNMLARVALEEAMDIHAPLSDKAAILTLAAFFGVLAAVAVGWTAGIRWRWLTTAGLLTYPFYLIHEAVGWIIIHYTHGRAPHWLILTAVLLLMLAAAWLLHRLLERPIAAYLRRNLTLRRPAAPGIQRHVAGKKPVEAERRHPIDDGVLVDPRP